MKILELKTDHEEFEHECFSLEDASDLKHLKRRLLSEMKDGNYHQIRLVEKTPEEWAEIQRISKEIM